MSTGATREQAASAQAGWHGFPQEVYDRWDHVEGTPHPEVTWSDTLSADVSYSERTRVPSGASKGHRSDAAEHGRIEADGSAAPHDHKIRLRRAERPRVGTAATLDVVNHSLTGRGIAACTNEVFDFVAHGSVLGERHLEPVGDR